MANLKWEDVHVSLVPMFKRDYSEKFPENDRYVHDLATLAVTYEFSITHSNYNVMHEAAVRLGLTSRKKAYTKDPGNNTRPVAPTDEQIDAIIAEREREIEQLKTLKAQRAIEFEWADDLTHEDMDNLVNRSDVVIVYGVDRNFRKLEGIPRFGKFLAETRGL